MHHDFVRPAAILHIRKTELGKSDPRPRGQKNETLSSTFAQQMRPPKCDLLERRTRAAAATATKLHAWETFVASCRADRLHQRVEPPPPAFRQLLSSSTNGPAMMFSALSSSRELTGTRSEPLSAADLSSRGVSLNTPMHQIYPTNSTLSGTCTHVPPGTAAAHRDGGYGGLAWKDGRMSLIMEHEDAMRSMREHHLNFTTTSGAMEDSTKQRTVHVLPCSSEREDELLAGFRPGGLSVELSEFPLQALYRR